MVSRPPSAGKVRGQVSASHVARTERDLNLGIGNRATARRLHDQSVPDGRRLSRGSRTQRGLPHRLRVGLEELSGYDLSSVRVHDASTKPARLGALAFATGQDIYLHPGQEQALAHEGWHVVQQLQGRVRPTSRNGSGVMNNETSLEREADSMGARALTQVPKRNARAPVRPPSVPQGTAIQRRLNPDVREALDQFLLMYINDFENFAQDAAYRFLENGIAGFEQQREDEERALSVRDRAACSPTPEEQFDAEWQSSMRILDDAAMVIQQVFPVATAVRVGIRGGRLANAAAGSDGARPPQGRAVPATGAGTARRRLERVRNDIASLAADIRRGARRELTSLMDSSDFYAVADARRTLFHRTFGDFFDAASATSEIGTYLPGGEEPASGGSAGAGTFGSVVTRGVEAILTEQLEQYQAVEREGIAMITSDLGHTLRGNNRSRQRDLVEMIGTISAVRDFLGYTSFGEQDGEAAGSPRFDLLIRTLETSGDWRPRVQAILNLGRLAHDGRARRAAVVSECTRQLAADRSTAVIVACADVLVDLNAIEAIPELITARRHMPEGTGRTYLGRALQRLSDAV